MITALFWIYFANATLLIIHEIDSAYWKEWELFKLPMGISGFLLLHFILVPVMLYGLVLVSQGTKAGYVISLLLSLGGLFAFGIHFYFLRQGRHEFGSITSQAILVGTGALSTVQIGITLALLF